MSDQIYKYAGPAGTVALYGDPFTIPGSWQEWVKIVWVTQLLATGYVLQPAPFIPVYESGVVTWPGNDGKAQSAPLNELEFPDQTTADKLAEMYGATTLNVPFFGLGPVSSAAVMRLLQFPNGATLPAYQLANYFTNNPEDKFPGVADRLSKDLVKRATETV